MIKNKEQVIQRATELRLRNWSHSKIAKELNVSPSTIQKVLAVLDRERRAAFIERFKELRCGERRYALDYVCKELKISKPLATYWDKKLKTGPIGAEPGEIQNEIT